MPLSRTGPAPAGSWRPQPRFPSDANRIFAPYRYTSWTARLHHVLLPLFVYAHVPCTIFLDYNTIFVLAQVAAHPETDGGAVGNVSGGSAVWWFALGIYALASLSWFFGVVVLYEGLLQYGAKWRNKQPPILETYCSPAAFNLTTFRSYSLYSFLYRLRFSAPPLRFFIETLWFFTQNWPTIATLIPRAIICAALLVIYNPDTSLTSSPQNPRDPAYFDPDSQLLATYGFVVLMVNVTWAAWRIGLLVLSAILYWITIAASGLHGQNRPDSRIGTESALSLRSHLIPAPREGPSALNTDTPGVNPDEFDYSPLPPPARMVADPSSQSGAPTPALRLSHEGRQLESRAYLLPEDFASLLTKPVSGWRAHVLERIWNLLDEQDLSESGITLSDTIGHSVRRADSAAAGMSQSTRVRDGDWVSEAGKSYGWRSQTPGTTRLDSEASTSVPLGLGLGPAARGLSSPTRPFSRTTGREMAERTTSPTSRSRPASVLNIAGSSPDAGESQGKTSPIMSPYTNPGGTFGRTRHTSLTFAVDVPQSSGGPHQLRLSRDRAVSDASSPAIGTSDSPPILQRPSPALEPSFHDRSAEGLARHVSVSGSTHYLSAGDSTNNTSMPGSASTSAAVETPGATSSLGPAATNRLLHPRSAGSLRNTAEEAIRPPDSPSGSTGSHSTLLSEDSEERRIWASFPDQSRKHPPGLIALKLEQKQIEAQEAAIAAEAARQRLAAVTSQQSSTTSLRNDGGDQTPRAYHEPSSSASAYVGMPGSSRDRERDLGFELSSQQQHQQEGAGMENMLSISPSERPLIPIKEESFSSSIGSARPSLTHSGSHPVSMHSRSSSGAADPGSNLATGALAQLEGGLTDIVRSASPDRIGAGAQDHR
ncbi:hypothetical protein OC846_004255 [Tilletia horrida]|uniref:Proteophosphoglycan ppg4 n=1 Tax=Tilletia horrida TaxID=155126 RepID=A0AAN6JQK4_9BASI|nr:hypothetical protein OC846_004255 [Tilletia horrida]KAK0549483.1 hypothetical protein OC845_003102 [Tilletia horrida]KAK0568945.1 hypothetical protein OC861_001472 [Tilletia horrida]